MQIKMHDGMVMKLDCWYVPELWKNLVSLGTLAKNGTRYAGDDYDEREDELWRDLYPRRNTVMGRVLISQSLNQGNDKKELWHHRLGDMSEKVMAVLRNRGLLGGEATGKDKVL